MSFNHSVLIINASRDYSLALILLSSSRLLEGWSYSLAQDWLHAYQTKSFVSPTKEVTFQQHLFQPSLQVSAHTKVTSLFTS